MHDMYPGAPGAGSLAQRTGLMSENFIAAPAFDHLVTVHTLALLCHRDVGFD